MCLFVTEHIKAACRGNVYTPFFCLDPILPAWFPPCTKRHTMIHHSVSPYQRSSPLFSLYKDQIADLPPWSPTNHVGMCAWFGSRLLTYTSKAQVYWCGWQLGCSWWSLHLAQSLPLLHVQTTVQDHVALVCTHPMPGATRLAVAPSEYLKAMHPLVRSS